MIYLVYVACAYIIVQWIAATTTMVSIFLDRARKENVKPGLLIIPVTIVYLLIAPAVPIVAGIQAKETTKQGLKEISDAITEAMEEVQ